MFPIVLVPNTIVPSIRIPAPRSHEGHFIQPHEDDEPTCDKNHGHFLAPHEAATTTSTSLEASSTSLLLGRVYIVAAGSGTSPLPRNHGLLVPAATLGLWVCSTRSRWLWLWLRPPQQSARPRLVRGCRFSPRRRLVRRSFSVRRRLLVRRRISPGPRLVRRRFVPETGGRVRRGLAPRGGWVGRARRLVPETVRRPRRLGRRRQPWRRPRPRRLGRRPRGRPLGRAL